LQAYGPIVLVSALPPSRSSMGTSCVGSYRFSPPSGDTCRASHGWAQHRIDDGTIAVQAGVENTGVKIDPTLGKEYIAFKDPDRMAWELSMA
jgi:hypothetical protein